MVHKHIIREKSKSIPSKRMPDGAVLGNGDLSAIWAGRPDRVELYIAKVDFWNADERLNVPFGPSPIGIVDIRMPYFAYSPYYVDLAFDSEKDVDENTNTVTFTLYYDCNATPANVQVNYPFSFRLPSGLAYRFEDASTINVVLKYTVGLGGETNEVTCTMKPTDFFLTSYFVRAILAM